MARYSPRDPGFTRVPGLLEGLTHVAQEGASGFTSARAAEEEEERRQLEEELQALELHEAGVRRRDQVTEELPEEEDIFAGQLPGTAPGGRGGMVSERSEAAPPLFRGQLPGRAESGLAPELARMGQQGLQAEPAEPQVIALPGAFVEGMGFTPEAITDQDLVSHTRAGARRAAGPRERIRPGVEQVTDDLFIDRAATPAGRQAAAAGEQDRARRGRLEAGLGALQERGVGGLDPREQADLLDSDVPASVIFGDEDEVGPDTFTVSGSDREFPNDPAGHAAALGWIESMAESRAQPRTGTDARVTGEVTRRQFAMAASRAVQSLQEEWAELDPYQREQRVEAGQDISQSIARAIALFGFDTVPDLQAEMRELRLAGVGTPPGGGGGGGAPLELSDEELAALLEENPELLDADPAEILRLLEEQGR